MTAQDMNEQLQLAKRKRIKIQPICNLKASNIGHPCERYLYLSLLHWSDREPHDTGLQNIYDLGHTLQKHTISNLKEAGFDLVIPTYQNWKIDKPLITGREIIRVKDERGNLIPLEIKILSSQDFNRVNTIEDFFASSKYYIKQFIGQMLIYMFYFNKLYGFFAVTNKLTGQTKIIRMDFDWDMADEFLIKAERIYRAIEVRRLPLQVENRQYCKGCSMFELCRLREGFTTPNDMENTLNYLISKKNSLEVAVNTYYSIDRQIKELVEKREQT